MTSDSGHDPKDYATKSEDDEYLTRVVIDTCARTFYLYSNEGEKKIVNCDTGDEFMNVLTLVRAVVSDDIIAYCDMLVGP